MPQWKHLKMVTHMVFTPVFFFVSDRVSRSVGAWAVFGSSLAAGPFVVSGLVLLLFFFLSFFGFRDDDEGSGPGAAADGGGGS